MEIRWDVTSPGRFDSEPLVVPARYSFPQGAIYRLKLSNIAGRPGMELYPTVEVAAAVPRTEAFLAHSAIPIQFTEEDFDQVLSGNFVTKVVYLPNPESQELALAGVETLVSTRLEPGKDPIIEATRHGAILAVVRLGNKDLQLPAAGGGAGDGVTATCVPGPVGLPDGRMPLLWRSGGLRCGRDDAAVWDADVRHAHRTAGSAPRAVGSPGRIAEPHHGQPYEGEDARADPQDEDRREGEARLLLSAAARSRPHRGTDHEGGASPEGRGRPRPHRTEQAPCPEQAEPRE